MQNFVNNTRNVTYFAVGFDPMKNSFDWMEFTVEFLIKTFIPGTVIINTWIVYLCFLGQRSTLHHQFLPIKRANMWCNLLYLSLSISFQGLWLCIKWLVLVAKKNQITCPLSKMIAVIDLKRRSMDSIQFHTDHGHHLWFESFANQFLWTENLWRWRQSICYMNEDDWRTDRKTTVKYE